MDDALTMASGEQAEGTVSPVARSDRIASLDFIRGVAVMGILLANIVGFGQPMAAYAWPGGFVGPDGDPGGWLWIAQFVLVDGKMRGLFTLLFGAGMVLFLDRARARGAGLRLQARRLGWLLAFGLAHYFLLWRGDILTLYAICGLLVLPSIDWKPHTHLVAGAVAYLAGALLWTGSFLFVYLVAETPFGRTPMAAGSVAGVMEAKSVPLADDARELALAQGGSWFDAVGHRLAEHGLDWLLTPIQVGWETIPLMWLGMALYRLGLFDGRLDRAAQARWGWIGIAAGAIATLALALWVQARDFSYFSTLYAFMGPSLFTRLPMILGLAALLALWTPHAGDWLGRRISAAGRMAFSNYVGTSFAMLFVFSGWALDLFGQFDRPHLYLLVLPVWALMLGWSEPWLARFRYGPLEWLWRSLTYGHRMAFRR